MLSLRILLRANTDRIAILACVVLLGVAVAGLAAIAASEYVDLALADF